MKVYFELDDETERDKIKKLVLADKMCWALWELREWFRNKNKYDDATTITTEEAYEVVREFCAVLDEIDD